MELPYAEPYKIKMVESKLVTLEDTIKKQAALMESMQEKMN